MNLQITGRHIENSKSINSFINSKLRKIDDLFEQSLQGHVILNVEKNLHSCEAKIQIPGNILFAVAKSENMYSSVDGLLDKLIKQAKKHKEKISNHGHKIPKKELSNLIEEDDSFKKEITENQQIN